MVTCPECGKDVKEAKFCSNCGALLPKAEEIVSEEVEETTIDAAFEESSEDEVDEVVDEEVVEEDASEEVQEVPDEAVDEEVVEEESTEEVVDGFRLIQEEQPQTKFCQSCGKKIDINSEICPYCGVRVANIMRSSEEKNVLLSAILSLLFPGLGHLYLGLNKKGISFIVAYIVSAILVFLVIGFVLIVIVWLWALIDSIKATESINRGEFVEDKLF